MSGLAFLFSHLRLPLSACDTGTQDCVCSPALCRAMLGGAFTFGAWRDRVPFVCLPGGLASGM
eukprot:2975394-Pyramimonas_sp.AAC.1